MSSETEAATEAPEAIESLDDDARAWYHNKVVVFGVMGGLLVLTFFTMLITLQPDAPPSSPGGDGSMGPAPIRTDADPSGNVGKLIPPERKKAMDSSVALAEDVFAPIDQPPEEPESIIPPLPDEPAEEPLPQEEPAANPRLAGLLPQTRDPSALTGRGNFGSPERNEFQARMQEQRNAAELDAYTAPSISDGAAWGIYWSSVETIGVEDELELAARIAAEPPPPTKGLTVLFGTRIPAVVEHATRSDGDDVPLTALVIRDVLDATDGHRVAIPKGSRLVGAQVGISWDRIKGFWQVVQFPGGESIPINAALAGADGSGGMRGSLHTGMLRRIGLGMMAASVSAAANIGIDEPELAQIPVGGGESTQDRYVAIQSQRALATRQFGHEISDLVRAEVEMMADRHIPYVNVSGGKQVYAVLTQDLRF